MVIVQWLWCNGYGAMAMVQWLWGNGDGAMGMVQQQQQQQQQNDGYLHYVEATTIPNNSKDPADIRINVKEEPTKKKVKINDTKTDKVICCQQQQKQ